VSIPVPTDPPDHDVRLVRLREAVHDSLWVVPLLFVLGAVALALVMHQVDQVTSEGTQPSFAFVGDASGAQQVLSRQHKLLEASADRAFSDIQDRRAAEPAGVTGVSRPR
jgi:uncharacterized membrane protein